MELEGWKDTFYLALRGNALLRWQAGMPTIHYNTGYCPASRDLAQRQRSGANNARLGLALVQSGMVSFIPGRSSFGSLIRLRLAARIFCWARMVP